MSYVDKLTDVEKAKYRVVHASQLITTLIDIIYSGLIVYSESSIKFSGEYRKIHFFNCYFKSHVTIENCAATAIIFENCFFDNSIQVKNVSVSDKLDFYANRVEWFVNIRDSKINELRVFISEAKEFDINTSQIIKGSIAASSDTIVPNINIRHLIGLLEIGYVNIERLNVLGSDSQASFVFDSLRVKCFEVDSIRNYQDFRIFNFEALPGQSKFEIKDSYLGKAEFYDVDFESFNTVTIARTHLIDCSFIDVDWNFKMNTVYDVNNDEYSSRETFRQLKYALGKQGDTINEQKFHTLEMLAHYKSLDWDTDGWNKAIIWLSYNTSNFGQSIWWPIRALFIGHSLFFLFALLTGLSSVHISFANASWSAFNTAVYEYFYLINPLHRTEDLPKDWTIIIDIFMRIWSSYMIYNIIRASRRFIK